MTVTTFGIIGSGWRSEFFLRLGPLADVIPLPIPPFQNVASIGDVFLTMGLAFFLFATVVRNPDEETGPEEDADHEPLTGLAGTTRLPRGIEAALGQRLRP